MPWLSSTVPKDVQTSLPREPGERVLAGTQDTNGRWIVGTDSALYAWSEARYQRRPWETIAQASWDREAAELLVVEVADFGAPEPREVVPLEEPGRVLELIRERVTASIMLTRSVPVRMGSSLKVVVRRSPTRTGDMTFAFVLDNDLDPGDEQVAKAAKRGLAEVRDELGL